MTLSAFKGPCPTCHRLPDEFTLEDRTIQTSASDSAGSALYTEDQLQAAVAKARQEERDACIEDVRGVGGSFAVECEREISKRAALDDMAKNSA